MKILCNNLFLLLFLYTSPSLATAETTSPSAAPTWEFHGYLDLNLSAFDYGPNQNRPHGSQKDRRMEFDATRLSFTAEAHLPQGYEVEAEVEFEHGGTGSTMELEYEEFGEYGQEVEHGGEVYLEELAIKKELSESHAVKVGLLEVAMGQTTLRNRPDHYLGTRRPEAEERIIPVAWTEIGVQYALKTPSMLLTAQVVNGLDSTGFSSSHWVGGGHQKRFETKRASDLAYVLRSDYRWRNTNAVGVGFYYGDTSRNRPKPDMVKTCSDADDDAVASCGYIAAPVIIADLHFHLAEGPWRSQGTALWGQLRNADDITDKNSRLSNNLNAPRTPVAKRARGAWAELGYDLAPSLDMAPGASLVPFVRLQDYDSMDAVDSGIADNPRFARKVYALGAAYSPLTYIVYKADLSQRILGSAAYRKENTLGFSAAFVF